MLDNMHSLYYNVASVSADSVLKCFCDGHGKPFLEW